MKIWIKTYIEDKIINDAIISRFAPFSRELFESMIKEACEKFDLSTPIILNGHYIHFKNFNIVKFLPRDFIETVDFDKMTVENISD